MTEITSKSSWLKMMPTPKNLILTDVRQKNNQGTRKRAKAKGKQAIFKVRTYFMIIIFIELLR